MSKWWLSSILSVCILSTATLPLLGAYPKEGQLVCEKKKKKKKDKSTSTVTAEGKRKCSCG